jgi:hypothetical protein
MDERFSWIVREEGDGREELGGGGERGLLHLLTPISRLLSHSKTSASGI